MRNVVTAVLVLALAGSVVVAQTSSGSAAKADPLSAGAKNSYSIIKGYVGKAATMMPEEHYSFKPTPEVRSFGQIIGHIADANYMICAAATGQKPPAEGIEKSKTSKADLTKALDESFAYCDSAHDGMTDAKGVEPVKFFTGEQPRLTVLEFNTHHDFEHYGNIVTYMRIKGLVPPSSQPQGRPAEGQGRP